MKVKLYSVALVTRFVINERDVVGLHHLIAEGPDEDRVMYKVISQIAQKTMAEYQGQASEIDMQIISQSIFPLDGIMSLQNLCGSKVERN